MAKRWYYKDENGNKVPVPQYKIDADDYYTKAMSDSRYYEKSATDTLLGDKVSKSEIVQSTGTSETAVMSQKAVSDAINKLKNAGYLYAGIATPTTNPGTPDGSVFYIANGKGTYTNFGGIDVTEDEVIIICYDTEWHKMVTGIASQDKLNGLESEVTTLEAEIYGVSEIDYSNELQFGSIKSTGIGNVNSLTIVPDNVWKYAIIPVIAGQRYELKLRGGSLYPACILLDINNVTIAEYAITSYTTQVVQIPDGVTTMVINHDPNNGVASIIRLRSEGLRCFIGRVEKKFDSVLPWNNMDVYQGWINSNGTFKENNGLIKLIPVKPNSIFTFRPNATTVSYLVVLKSFNQDTYFFDKADCVESYPQRVLVDNNTSLLMPDDARYIAITYYDITNKRYCYPDAIFVDGIDITLIYKSLMAWDDLYEYSGYISYKNIFEQDTACFKLIPVKGGDKLFFQQNTTITSYYFMLRGFDDLRYIQYPPYFSKHSNKRLQVVTGRIVIPDDVRYIAITSKNSNGVDNSPYMIEINGVDIKQFENPPIDIISLNADKDSIISSSSAFMGSQSVSGQKTKHKYLTLLHGSDYHADEYNFIRTMDFAAHYSKDIDAVIISGDIVLNTFAEDSYEKLYANHYQEAGCSVLPVIGNHELGYGEDNAKYIYNYNGMTNSVDDCAARFITPYMTYNGCIQGDNGGYYYKDFSQYKVRIITICEYEMPRILEEGTESISKYAFWYRYISQTQVDWFVTTLNSVQEDWSVIVVMHQPIDTIIKFDNPFSSPYMYGGLSAQGKIIQDIIDAYIDKTSINNVYTNTKGYNTAEVPDVTVNADFSNAKGTFICYLCGHTHFDMIGQSSLATNKQVCVVMNTSSTTKAYYDDLYRCMHKQSQDCLNILVFDTDKKQIRIIRIGANTTLDMKERKMTCISYGL